MARAVPQPNQPQPRSQAEPERRRSNNPIRALFDFVGSSWSELKKVEWPGQNQVIQGTVVVLVACVVVGIYLYVNDQVWKHFVSSVLLGE